MKEEADFSKDFIVDMVGTMQRMRRESLVDLQILCVTVWMITKIGEHRKSVFGREDYIINLGHLKVRTASSCIGASESLRNFPEVWVRPGVCFLHIFVKLENGRTSFTERNMV